MNVDEHSPEVDMTLRGKLELVASSFLQLTGRPLLEDAHPLSFWQAPRVIVAHGIEADPVFFYGNRLALAAFEMRFADFVRLPSRFSAEAINRDERMRLLDRVSRVGFIDDYSGVRIAASGRRFRIEQAVVWNLIDANSEIHGQAATFEHWVNL